MRVLVSSQVTAPASAHAAAAMPQPPVSIGSGGLQAADVLGHFARMLVPVRATEQTILTLGSMALSVFFIDADCTNIQLNAMGVLCEIFTKCPAHRLQFVEELCDSLPKLPKASSCVQLRQDAS